MTDSTQSERPAPQVLLVDDSPVMRSFLKRALSVCGFPVGSFLEAGDGKQALDVLSRETPDLVLTDINMPVLDGEGFLRALRQIPAHQNLPVVVVSTDATEGRVMRLLELGANGYLSKPFEPERLANLLSRVLGTSEDQDPSESGSIQS
jgi:two-component system, chemotaxis family, chemotaxis protein CheY